MMIKIVIIMIKMMIIIIIIIVYTLNYKSSDSNYISSD